MENVITAIFTVESEAYKAFTEVRNTPFGPGYTVAEAALVKRENDSVTMIDSFDTTGHTSDDTAAGVLVGSILGILGGPLGILLGAGAGALVGSAFDADDADDSLSALEVTAAKLLEGDVAIIALVQEDEPAFDAALEGYDAIIMRYFAVDVADEVDAAREAEAEMAVQLREQLRSDRKAERQAKRDERSQKIKDRFTEAKAKRAARKEARAEAKEIANAQFTSSTKEMLGEE
jgi:uncharacterized membrane protein